jgi:hypothetical protein
VLPNTVLIIGQCGKAPHLGVSANFFAGEPASASPSDHESVT